MKLAKEFNQYLANLVVFNYKVHNLHWNLEGPEFVALHEYTDEIYEEAFEYFDEVAELFKMFGQTPDSTLAAYLKNASLQEIEARPFTGKETLEILSADLEALRKEATELRNASDEEGWFSAVAMLEDQIASYNKRLWFINASLK